MNDPTCIFCQIIAREAPAYILDENEQVIVFLALSNHPMVVPKAHIPDLFAMPDDVGAAIMAEAAKVARALRAALGCDGVYLTQANGYAAAQDVFHYHLHLYPAWGDTLRRAVEQFAVAIADPAGMTDESKTALAEKLRRHL